MRIAAWACLSFSAGVFIAQYLLPAEAFLWAAAVCALLGLAGFFFHGRPRRRICLALFGLSLGILCFFVQYRSAISPAVQLDGETVTVSARVISYPDIYDDSEYAELRLTEPELPDIRCRVSSYDPGTLSFLRPGDEVRVTLRLRSASVLNGEEVDTYHAKGIFLRGSVTDEVTVTGRWKYAFLYYPKTISRDIVSLCRRVFPADVSPFLQALLTGNKRALYDDGEHLYPLQAAGLSHVIAISGMHISFLTGVLLLVLGRRKRVIWICAPVLLLFAAMTGFTPSVSRAVFMQLCMLTAPVVRRENDPITSLSVSLAVLLVLNPSACASLSLQLSFGAMGGIVMVSERIFRALQDRWEGSDLARFSVGRKLPALLAGSLSSSIGALLLTMPLCALQFGTIALLAPLSNLLCLWMVSFVYIGGFASVLAGAVFLPAGVFLGRILAWGARYIFWITAILFRFPRETLYTRGTIYGLWLAWVYLLFIAAWLMAKRQRKALRPVAPLCLSLCLLCVCFLTERDTTPEELTLHTLDVGQGACHVLTAGEHTVVVDCGGTVVTKNAGETARYYLGSHGKRHVDALILTHLHCDHVNGAAELLTCVDVDTLFLPREESEIADEILTAAEHAGTEIVFVENSLKLTAGDMEITLLSPLTRIAGSNSNEQCLIVLASRGEEDIVISGDAGTVQERSALRRLDWPDVEVLVVGHHGSDSAADPEWLETLRPDAAVISVGYNIYGHPTQVVLDRLQSYGIPVYRTDELGSVTVTARKE